MIGGPALQTNAKKEQSGPPFVSTAAVNGLSVDPVSGAIVLGNDQAAAGDPARLLSNRDIFSGAFGIQFRQALFSVSSPGVLSISLDGTAGGPIHGISIDTTNQPSGNIMYRATHNDANCIGAIIQLETPGDALSAVCEIAAWGSSVSNPVYRRGASGVISLAVLNPDLVFQANAKGPPGPRAGRIIFATNNGGTETQTYSFLLPVLANLDFPLTAAQTSSDLTINVPGAADGDSVSLGVPIASQVANTCYTAFVSAPDTVTVRFNNYSAAGVNPAAGNFKVGVVKLL